MVVSEVTILLLKVEFMLLFITSATAPFLRYLLFSLILSKITIVSLMDYPNTVSMAAINGLLIS